MVNKFLLQKQQEILEYTPFTIEKIRKKVTYNVYVEKENGR